MVDAKELAKNLSDGYVYRVLRTEKERDASSENYGRKVIRLERLHDNYQDTILASVFDRAYASITEQQAHDLLRTLLSSPSGAIPEFSPEQLSPDTSPALEQGMQLKTAVGILIEPDETHDFSKMVCYPSVIQSVKAGLNKIKLQSFLDDEWGLKEVSSKTKQSILNFYGPPGTGKTMMSGAVARMLSKKLLVVNYAELESKWVGETGKHISLVFAEAKRLGAIIFWDEADSMLSSRIAQADDSVSKGLNTNRNILMQEMDRYEGIMITATNDYRSFDPAMVRRISQNIHFELPNREMREALFRLKIPKKVPLAGVNFEALAKMTDGFSGDDIRKACEQALVEAASQFEDHDKNKRVLRQEFLLESVQRIHAEKLDHKGGARKVIGFHASS